MAKKIETEVQRPVIRKGRPRLYGDEKKFNKTIRLSATQEKYIYDHYPTLQAWIEEKYAKDIKKSKKAS